MAVPVGVRVLAGVTDRRRHVLVANHLLLHPTRWQPRVWHFVARRYLALLHAIKRRIPVGRLEAKVLGGGLYRCSSAVVGITDRDQKPVDLRLFLVGLLLQLSRLLR